MYVHRQLEEKIKPFISRKEAIAIVGPRQAGKSTFLKHLEQELISKKKKVKNITFENKNDFNLFTNSIEDFKLIAQEYEYIIIDEFQYAKDGGQKLKYLYDTTKIKFIISGSSSLDLTFQTGKYMVGRMLEFQLMPFSFREFLSFKDPEIFQIRNKKIPLNNIFEFNPRNGFKETINVILSNLLEKFVLYGGYPAVSLAKDEIQKNKILEGIIKNYLLRDINTLLHLATEDELIKLTSLLSAQIGNMLNYQELSLSSNLNYESLKKHLNILEKTFIIKLVKPYFTNRRTELVKNPKVYFFDSGLRNYILSDFRPLPLRNDTGALMENYAFSVLNSYDNIMPIKYWRTKSKAEVDFIYESQQNIYPFEVKYSSQKIIGKSLFSFIEKFNPKTAFILTKDYLGEEKIKNTNIKFIPLSYI